MHKFLLPQILLFSILMSTLASATYEGVSARLQEINALEDGFEDFQQAIKELYFICGQAKDEASCKELSETQMCVWGQFRRTFKNLTTFTGIKEFVIYEAEAHCGVNLVPVLQQNSMGLRAIGAIAWMISAVVSTSSILDGNPSFMVRAFALLSSAMGAHLFYKLWRDLKVINVLPAVHKNATLGLVTRL